MMLSCRQHSHGHCKYVLFHANASVAPYLKYDFIDFIAIDLVYGLPGSFSARRYKYIPLSHEYLQDKDVLFLDADSLVFNDCLEDLFQAVRDSGTLIYGSKRPRDFKWFSDVDQSFADWNLVCESRKLGLHIENISLNSGIAGRSSSLEGKFFGEKLKHHLHTLQLYRFTHKEFEGAYFNDEPYFALARHETNSAYSMEGALLSGTKTYMTTAGNCEVLLENSSVIVRKNQESCRPKICHFVGFRRFPVYHELVNNLLN